MCEENIEAEKDEQHRKGFEHTTAIDALHIGIHQEQRYCNEAGFVAVKLADEQHDQYGCDRREEDVQVPHRKKCRDWIRICEPNELDVGCLDQHVSGGMPHENAAIFHEANSSRHVGSDYEIRALIREDIR